MIISRLKLYNWKNFQNVDINLTERNFIIGSNASGKSNLFDSLRFLRDISKQAGGLQSAVEIRGGIKKIRCLAARKRSDILVEIDLSDEKSDELLWTYSLNFMHTGGGVIKSEAKILSEKVYDGKEKKWITDRNENSKEEDTETLKYTHLEQVTANKKFREIQLFFQNLEYLNVVPQLVRESSSYNSTKIYEDYFGRNFLERISLINEKTRNAYFRRINSVLKLAVPQLEELQFHKDKMGVPHLEAKYIHWRAKGSKQSEDQFSDGTIRLIGFLWALIDSNGTILLEEPEINLHSEIVKQFPEFISKIQRSKKSVKQVLISTHSYDLLNNKGIGTNEVLVLENSAEGTNVKTINEIEQIKAIIDSGFSIADATIPFTAPKEIHEVNQLNLNFSEQ
ncbi:MAG: AAA family ATPase [Prolixibacteraceae bacterium]|nr:AAA family ATPase [Prolixibacteraceae bacterium]